MPGFQPEATQPSETDKAGRAEFRRKHRWRFRVLEQVTANGGGKPAFNDNTDWILLQKAARPSFKYDEAVVHHDQEEAYFAGKQKWDPIALVWYDSLTPDVSSDVWDWIQAVSQFTEANSPNVSLPSDYKKNCAIEMTSGTGGNADETWHIINAWPKEVNWNDLDYTNTEIQLINVQMRFDRAVHVAA